MASIVRDPRRGTWSVQWNNGDRWVRRVIVRRLAGWKRGDAMPDEPPSAVLEALETCRQREQEAKLGRELSAKHSIAELLGQVPLAINVGDTSELAARLDKAFQPFRAYCLRNGIERLEQVNIAVWSLWIKDGLHTAQLEPEPEPHEVESTNNVGWVQNTEPDTSPGDLRISIGNLDAKASSLY